MQATDQRPAPLLALALTLSLGAAVSLGIARFAYGLLLPPMREDLQWSYTQAGVMNTANAVGYLAGALLTPLLMRRFGSSSLLVAGAVLSTMFMALSGFFISALPLLTLRFLAGTSSAILFIAGGLLAAGLGARRPGGGGFLMGIYYGGTGLGILLSALMVPALLRVARDLSHGWAVAWWGLSLACAFATVALIWPARAVPRLNESATTGGAGPAKPRDLQWREFAPSLASYLLFGAGYIGYMTFVVALLKEQGAGAGGVTFFYSLLGIAVFASSRIWAGLLDRYRGGQTMAILNLLLAIATLAPAVTSAWALVLLSGTLFGGVFLSVVASTTALVRHNLPPEQWGAGITAFTIVFAIGQIVGPTIVGWIADGSGGLRPGLTVSAATLLLASLLACAQRPLVK